MATGAPVYPHVDHKKGGDQMNKRLVFAIAVTMFALGYFSK
jgi:hypothetical protein